MSLIISVTIQSLIKNSLDVQGCLERHEENLRQYHLTFIQIQIRPVSSPPRLLGLLSCFFFLLS